MRCALKLQQEFNRQTYIFTGNLKVAGNGLEALYRQTKEAGTVFMKFTETIPDIHVNKDGNLTIVYVDEVIRETFKLNPDVTVIDEALNSSTFSHDIADKLKIETGPDGFIQSDNVHRATVLTNKKGVFVAGLSGSLKIMRRRSRDKSSVVQRFFHSATSIGYFFFSGNISPISSRGVMVQNGLPFWVKRTLNSK